MIRRFLSKGRAVQDPAEVIDGSGVQRLVFPELVNGCTGNVMLVNQSISGVRRVFQSISK